jgi:hypothetical protein
VHVVFGGHPIPTRGSQYGKQSDVSGLEMHAVPFGHPCCAQFALHHELEVPAPKHVSQSAAVHGAPMGGEQTPGLFASGRKHLPLLHSKSIRQAASTGCCGSQCPVLPSLDTAQ